MFNKTPYDPKFMDVRSIYPVKMSLKDILEELGKRREVERIAASPIKIGIDEFKLPTKEEMNEMFGISKFAYNKIIFNGPCTIVLWADGTKTIAKLYEDIDKFDPEKGVAICFMKKILGHTETNKILRKATKQYVEDRKESNRDFIEKIKETFTPMNKYLNVDISSVIKEVKQVEDDERAKEIEKAKEAVKHASDDIKYHLYTGEEIKVSADKNIGEVFFDDTKEEVEDADSN